MRLERRVQVSMVQSVVYKELFLGGGLVSLLLALFYREPGE